MVSPNDRPTCQKQGHLRPAYFGHKGHPEVYGRLPPWKVPMWFTHDFCASTNSPHVGGIVADTTIPKGNEVLRSEVVSALHVIQHQIKLRRFPGQKIPVCEAWGVGLKGVQGVSPKSFAPFFPLANSTCSTGHYLLYRSQQHSSRNPIPPRWAELGVPSITFVQLGFQDPKAYIRRYMDLPALGQMHTHW